MSRIARLVAALCLAAAAAPPPPPSVVAAESVYGDVAGQIGGPDLPVASILSNPDQDPHLFEASASVARGLAGARIVIVNGADYDPWMASLLEATPSPDRRVIVVADLIGRKAGENPHVWYGPAAVLALAGALADALAEADPAHASDYRARLESFRASLAPIQARIAALRARLAGTPVTATEPVFGDMLHALGLEVRNEAFQRAVMNGTEPSVSEVAAFEDSLRGSGVRMLVTNSQVSDPLTERMAALAREAGIPVVGVSETEPPGRRYQDWIAGALDDVERALSRAAG